MTLIKATRTFKDSEADGFNKLAKIKNSEDTHENEWLPIKSSLNTVRKSEASFARKLWKVCTAVH